MTEQASCATPGLADEEAALPRPSRLQRLLSGSFKIRPEDSIGSDATARSAAAASWTWLLKTFLRTRDPMPTVGVEPPPSPCFEPPPSPARVGCGKEEVLLSAAALATHVAELFVHMQQTATQKDGVAPEQVLTHLVESCGMDTGEAKGVLQAVALPEPLSREGFALAYGSLRLNVLLTWCDSEQLRKTKGLSTADAYRKRRQLMELLHAYAPEAEMEPKVLRKVADALDKLGCGSAPKKIGEPLRLYVRGLLASQSSGDWCSWWRDDPIAPPPTAAAAPAPRVKTAAENIEANISEAWKKEQSNWGKYYEEDFSRKMYYNTQGLAEMLGLGKGQQLAPPTSALNGTVPVPDVRLVRASELIKVGYSADNRKNLPPRQELERRDAKKGKWVFYADQLLLVQCLNETREAAFDGTSEMTYPGIVVLSYCWGAPMRLRSTLFSL